MMSSTCASLSLPSNCGISTSSGSPASSSPVSIARFRIARSLKLGASADQRMSGEV